ncbi:MULTISPECIES: ClpXP adapter SpxH family protein [Planococcus]|uniref:ClpXP adapter protein SpxH n=2 Tax=Planococcus TaxID=1372 RepID=A0ABM5WXD6_9BACL|nr:MULTISPECIES: ClpXP adapter SpxH family protein [Planococcus]ALS78079.1 dithiol-disulfide isomerase [Planococcus kocurii]AQU80018.1 DsbA family protein [Planococcus faecalis]KAA0958532.1 DsbA family protein [Planococcus sp. ANT_H30]MDJ0330612.1 ClpXP adapter SpxH family protein [Planococcus sp. S3-L1]OHX53574.1 dithiol-disulfide isomerase [Planococcus faecalis]
MSNLDLVEEIHEPVSSFKPMELYVFVDPLNPECWEMQGVIRKLQIEYGHYFSMRIVLSTQLLNLNKTILSANIETDNLTHPVLPSVAIKAAELQGKRSGNRFLHKLQEHLFLQSKDVSSYSVLLEIAEEAELDQEEFKLDFHSVHTAKAFQCDLKITREMEINEVPSIVFFNECIEDEGVKVSGLYSYDVYQTILQEMMGEESLNRQTPPSLDDLFTKYSTMATREIASIYNISEQTAECELKKQVLQQKLERICMPKETLWKVK